MGKTLLEKAREIEVVKKSHTITEEGLELSLAWAKKQVTTKQVEKALGMTNAYGFLARHLAHEMRRSE